MVKTFNNFPNLILIFHWYLIAINCKFIFVCFYTADNEDNGTTTTKETENSVRNLFNTLYRKLILLSFCNIDT